MQLIITQLTQLIITQLIITHFDDFGDGKLESAQNILKKLMVYLTPLKLEYMTRKTWMILISQLSLILLALSETFWQITPFSLNFFTIFYKQHPTGNVFYSSKEKLSEEELFTKKWGSIEHLQTFQLFINDQHQITRISNGIANSFMLSESVSRNIAQFLNNIPSFLHHKLNPELRFMHMISQFAPMLMENQHWYHKYYKIKENSY